MMLFSLELNKASARFKRSTGLPGLDNETANASRSYFLNEGYVLYFKNSKKLMTRGFN